MNPAESEALYRLVTELDKRHGAWIYIDGSDRDTLLCYLKRTYELPLTTGKALVDEFDAIQ